MKLYDCQSFAWHSPTPTTATQRPDPRSSFSFHPHEGGAVLYGGYSRVKANKAVGKQLKGSTQVSRSVLRPHIHDDTWYLRVALPSDSSAAPQIRWERRKKPANSPNPARAGATQAYHRGRGILFGGVYDIEDSEESIDSEFFNQLFAWNIERNRFFPLVLKRARPATRRTFDDRKRGRGKADEAELLRNLAALEQDRKLEDIENLDIEMSEDEEVPARPPKPVQHVMPNSRFNALLAVQKDTLYILGGTFEKGDQEYTFDEMYSIDLGRLDGVAELYRRDIGNWIGDVSELESDEEESDIEVEEDEPGGVTILTEDGIELEAVDINEQGTTEEKAVEAEGEEEQSQTDDVLPDDRPYPRPFESLKEFFRRTTNEWQELVLQELREKGAEEQQSVKELRKAAFEHAEKRWWDCREEISAEEQRQEEAGIGEVVNLAERTKDMTGAGRRR